MRDRLHISVLGELKVAHDGKPCHCPHQRRPARCSAIWRSLGRPLTRDHLCDLFWEGPDDPRAALRWSLHKIRRIANGDGQKRLTADNSRAFLDPQMIELDFRRISRLRPINLNAVSTPDLESLVEASEQPFLEGLFLPRCPEIRSVAGSPCRCRSVSSDSASCNPGESDEHAFGARVVLHRCSAKRCRPAGRQRAPCRVGRG